MIDAAESIAAKWVRSLINPGSVQQAVRDELLRTVPMLRRLPRHIDRAFTMLERDGIAGARVATSPTSTTTAVRHHAREPARARLPLRRHRLVSVGLIAIEGGPPFSGSTSLFRVFGYFGLFCATVLAMRVHRGGAPRPLELAVDVGGTGRSYDGRWCWRKSRRL